MNEIIVNDLHFRIISTKKVSFENGQQDFTQELNNHDVCKSIQCLLETIPQCRIMSKESII